MTNEKAFAIGSYASFKGKPRIAPEYLSSEFRKAWVDGYDADQERAAA
jgi:hypothetical protein